MDVHISQTSCQAYFPPPTYHPFPHLPALTSSGGGDGGSSSSSSGGGGSSDHHQQQPYSPPSVFSSSAASSSSSSPTSLVWGAGAGLAGGDVSLLRCLNEEKAVLYLPVIVFLAVLVVVGALGNTLVLCVYWRKPYKASSHYFILSLAVLDLFSCLVGLPTEIADLRFPYLFDFPIACKLLRFTHSSTIIASSSILIQVAFDRYYRICKLGQQFSVRKAKVLCVLSILMGVLTSWPSCLLFGRKTLNLHVATGGRGVRGWQHRYYYATSGGGKPQGDGSPGSGFEEGRMVPAPLLAPERGGAGAGVVVLRASDCSTEDAMRGTVYPTIYYLFLFTLFFLTVTFFAVLYIRIGVAIWRRKRKTMIGAAKAAAKVNSHGSDQTSTELSSEVEAATDNGHHPHHHHPHHPHHHPHPHPPTPYLTGTLPRGGGNKKKEAAAAGEAGETTQHHHQQYYHHQQQNKRRQIRVGKTTTVLFAVTLAYILSFLPYLVVMILRSVIRDFEGRLSPVGEVAYKFCVKSFFINNAINPLIYSFLNASFRADARKALRKMWLGCCCRCDCCGERQCCCCCCGVSDMAVLPQQSPIAV